MDFKNIKCPVCNSQFKDGDDIVVCPECGAPHHRECYENLNHCAFEDKHSEGFNFNDSYEADGENSENGEETVICPRCKSENPKNMFYCGKCGFPLSMQNQQNTGNFNNPQGTQFANIFDPMAGVNPEEDMGEGVTAGEISKFVQNNTPYFIRVFNNIKNFSKGRFNFCAFLFSGGYLLYRKMYKIGAIITAVMLVLWMSELYIHYCTPAGQQMIEFMNNYYNSAATSMNAVSELYRGIFSLDLTNQILLGVMYISSIAQIVLKIVIGIKANRWYFKHCKNQIAEIKAENENPESEIQARGGVNTAIAISLLAVYFIIEFIPFFVTGGI
ncbi:MAG: DUF2628 domain-containing protein [Ruminococcus sp.]|nr:DUF2628 domain-containing protein [Ruminococcus sp.]